MHAFTVMPFALSNPTQPTLAASDWQPFEDYETDSVDHWLLGVDASSLLGVKAKSALTPQGADHVFGAHSVTLPAWGGALISNVTDMPARTLCAVVKRPTQASITTNNVIVAGTASSISAQGGSSHHFFASTTAKDMRDLSYGNTPINAIVPVPASVADAEWVFIAYGINAALGGTRRYSVNGAQTESAATTTAGVISTKKIAVGNAYFDSASFKALSLEVAEFAIFAGQLSLADLQTLYVRAKGRSARRGIVLD